MWTNSNKIHIDGRATLPVYKNLLLKYFGFYNQEDTARPTMLPASHFDKQEKQAQPYS